MNKFLNLTLRTLAVFSAIGEFRVAHKQLLSAAQAVRNDLTLLEKVLVYVPMPELPEDLEARRRAIKADVVHLLRGDTVEQLDAYYEICFRTVDLLREIGVDAVFVDMLAKSLDENYRLTVSMIDALAANDARKDDTFVQGTNVSAILRSTGFRMPGLEKGESSTTH